MLARVRVGEVLRAGFFEKVERSAKRAPFVVVLAAGLPLSEPRRNVPFAPWLLAAPVLEERDLEWDLERDFKAPEKVVFSLNISLDPFALLLPLLGFVVTGSKRGRRLTGGLGRATRCAASALRKIRRSSSRRSR